MAAVQEEKQLRATGENLVHQKTGKNTDTQRQGGERESLDLIDKRQNNSFRVFL